MDAPTPSDTLSVHFTGTVNRIFEHEQKLAVLSEQVGQLLLMCRETRLDIKSLSGYAERHAERDAIYDKLLRLIPVSIALISGIYWIFSHIKNN